MTLKKTKKKPQTCTMIKDQPDSDKQGKITCNHSNFTRPNVFF